MRAFTFTSDINEKRVWFIHQPLKQSPCFIFNGLTQTVWHYRSKTELVLLSWLNRCSIMKQKRVRQQLGGPSVYLLHFISFGEVLFFPGRRVLWFGGESEHLRLNVRALRSWQNSWVVLGNTPRGRRERRESSCWQLDAPWWGGEGGEERREEEEEGEWMVVGVWGKGGGGVSLRWISLQSSVIGLRSEQPDWGAPPFSFFLLVLFVFFVVVACSRALAARCVQGTAWKPNPCSACTERSLSLSRCACSISPSPSWTTWWALIPRQAGWVYVCVWMQRVCGEEHKCIHTYCICI